jgi:NADPH:quinone reductase
MDLVASGDAGQGDPMRAVLCDRFEGIAALRIGETAEPIPADDEILIDVHAASVSYMDYLMASGGYQMRPSLPYVPGTDAAGVVVAVGDKVGRFRPGDRVACGNWFGCFAERMVARASKSARIPDSVDFFVGSTVLHAYLTAWYALVDRARLQPGETVLIAGAAGGVGLACVEVARLTGGRVIAAVGSAVKAQAARDGGAEHVIDTARTSANG